MIELLSDLWEYSELPYRCPRCGNSKNFPTLSSLKAHLEVDHSYRSPNRVRSNSPLLECYSKEARELEKQLQDAKDSESRNHKIRLSLKNYYDDINSLSDQIIRSKQNQWNKSDALYDAQEQIEKLSRNADKAHVDVINRMQDEMHEKESLLEKAGDDLNRLNNERKQLHNEVHGLKHQNNSNAENLGKLRANILQKDGLIQEKEREIDDMKDFLQATAEKEEVARKKLEDFIGGLLKRTEKAEGELAVLKSLNNTPQSTLARSANKPQFQTPLMNGSHPVQRTPSLLHASPSYPPMNGVRDVDMTIPYEDAMQQQQMTAPVLASPGAWPSQNPEFSDGETVYEDMIVPMQKDQRDQTFSKPNRPYIDSGLGDTTNNLPYVDHNSLPNGGYGGRTPDQHLMYTDPHPYDKDLSIDENGIMWEPSPEKSDDQSHFTEFDDYQDGFDEELDDDIGLIDDLEQALEDQSDELEEVTPKEQRPVASGSDAVKSKNSAESQNEKRYRDALFCIFMYLDTRTLSQVSAVSREWMNISRHPALWRKVELVKEKVSAEFLNTISKWCTQLQSLTLDGIKTRSRNLSESTDDYRSQTRGCLEVGLERLFQVSQNTLVSLRIIDCGHILTDRALWLASCYSRNLKRVAYVSDTDPAGAEVIWALGAGCREISTLIVPPMYPNERPEKFTNRCAYMIGRCWPHLQVLCIGGVEVDIRGLVSVVRNCPHLQVLELDHMCEVTEDVAMSMCQAGLKDLDALDFTFTPVTPKALLHFKSACPKVTSICVHIGISDYFEDTQRPQHVYEYNQIINKIKSLKKRSAFEGILKIKADYG